MRAPLGIVQASEASGRIAMVAENWAFTPTTRRVRDLLISGSLGHPNMLLGRHESSLRVVEDGRPGYLLAAGIHSIDVAQLLVGPIVEVMTYGRVRERASDGPTNDVEMIIAARFKEDVLGNFYFTGTGYRSTPGLRGFRILCSRGTVDFDVFAGTLEWTRGDSRQVVSDLDQSRGFREEIEHFLDCMEGGDEPLTSVARLATASAVVDAAYRSLRTGSPVDITSTHAH